MLFATEDRPKSVHFREALNSFRRSGFGGLRLYYYGARYLNPRTSRWVSADPGDGGVPATRTLQRRGKRAQRETAGYEGCVQSREPSAVYTYSGNNPVRYTDPSGRDVGNPGRDEPPERKLYGWPVATGRVASGYGPRNDATPTLHLALDIAPLVPGEKGGAVLAMEEGVVVRAGKNEHGLSVIEIKHPDGNTTVYNHQENEVSVGEHVTKGQRIGAMSDIGAEPGMVHVHIEVRIGGDYTRREDPTQYMEKRPASIILGNRVKEEPETGSISNQ